MVDSCSFGRIVIDGQTYTSDVVIHPHEVRDPWRRRSGHRLLPGDLEGVLEAEADTIIVGTGKMELMRVPDATREHLESLGFEFLVQRTDQACESYNGLSQEGPVIAALHLSC